MFHDMWGFYGAVAANDAGISGWEFYGDVEPLEGFRIRAGRWLVGLGPSSGRRVEQRAFVDAPLHTERFLGADGLFDIGLQLQYRAPIKTVPLTIEAAILRGSGTSFSPPLSLGSGATAFEQMLYMARLRIYPGAAFGQHLALGITFATGQNNTGPGNRTELIGADVEGWFNLPSEVQLGVTMEYLLRRYSIPLALEVEGTLSTEVVIGWKRLLTGVRLDLMGLPTPAPLRERLEYRLSTVAGYTPTNWIRIRGQYNLRNDHTEGDLVHEFMLQAVIGLETRFGGKKAHSSRRYRTRKTHPPTAESAPRPSSAPQDWLKTSQSEMAAAEALKAAGQYPASVQHAQRGAFARVKSALHARAEKASARTTDAATAQRRSITLGMRALTNEVPATVLSAARRLDRAILFTAAPSPLGGAPSDYFDIDTAERAIQDARVIIGWMASR